MVCTDGFLLESAQRFYIDTTPGGVSYTWARLGAGFNNVDPQVNEENDQTAYLDGNGWASSTITGGQLTLAFEGHRKYGDVAQDYIFSKQIALGCERETNFLWVQPNGEAYYGACTIAVIGGPGGDANAKGEINVEIHFNGEPAFLPSPASPTGLATGTITSSSVALSWDAVTMLGATITYNVYQDGVLLANSPTNSYAVTGLTTGTQYDFYVTAVSNFNQESAPSTTVSATTL